MYGNIFIFNKNIGENQANHRHIQVEPTDTFKGTTSPTQSQQLVDVQPNIIVQHRRTTIQTNSTAASLQPSTQDPLNEAYIERDNTDGQQLTTQNARTNINEDSTSTVKHFVDQGENNVKTMTPPPSPATQELNRIWKKQKQPVTSTIPTLINHKHPKAHRPSCRLKNYDDDSDSETTAAGTQSKDEGM